MYTSQNVNTIQTKIRIGSASEYGAYKFTGLEVTIPAGQDIVIRWDAAGLHLNGELLRGVSEYQNNTLDRVHEELKEAENILIGSEEGTARSHAHYNYIKYVRYDGAL